MRPLKGFAAKACRLYADGAGTASINPDIYGDSVYFQAGFYSKQGTNTGTLPHGARIVCKSTETP